MPGEEAGGRAAVCNKTAPSASCPENKKLTKNNLQFSIFKTKNMRRFNVKRVVLNSPLNESETHKSNSAVKRSNQKVTHWTESEK